MPAFNQQISGARSVSNNSLSPRRNRGSTAQVHSYWKGGLLDSTFDLEYLVIGGGGAGGIQVGGGGGAGGYRTNIVNSISGRGTTAENKFIVTPGMPYRVTIGAGGVGGFITVGVASSPTGTTAGPKGGDSIFGPITSIGGGGGSGYSGVTAVNGGSGGGADGGGVSNIGAGTTAQGYAGGQGVSSNWAGGGGGGAGAVGGNAGANLGGAGGAGLVSSITGIPTFRAGGGGGGQTSSTGGAGGSGGGGNGGSNDIAGANGLPNTGGGGGGCRDNAVNGSGGSGVVIIAYPISYAEIASISSSLNYSVDTTTRFGYRVYTFKSGTGTIQW